MGSSTASSLHYNILNRDMCDIRDKLLCCPHKALKFFLQPILRILPPHPLSHLRPRHPLEYLVADDPLHPQRHRHQPLLHLLLDGLCGSLALLQDTLFPVQHLTVLGVVWDPVDGAADLPEGKLII